MHADFIIENGVLVKYTGPGGDVVIPEGVTKIGDLVFQDDDTLSSIDLPDSLVEIGEGAFCNCEDLTEITIPKGVRKIGRQAFAFCYALKKVRFMSNDVQFGAQVFWRCPNAIVEGLDMPPDFIIVDGVLSQYTGSGGEVVIPDGVIRIEKEAFSGDSHFYSVVIPESVTEIGNRAFAHCTRLHEVKILGKLTKMGAQVFKDCPIERIESPDMQGDFLILDGKLITCLHANGHVVVPDGVTEIAANAFTDWRNDYSVTEITLPESVTRIGDYAFAGCTRLVRITIPNSVTEIGKGAFAYCAGLNEVNLSQNTQVAEDAFPKHTVVHYR